MNAPIRDDFIQDAPLGPNPQNRAIIATRLVEAAWCAQDGDEEAAKAHIAHAIALLQGQLTVMPLATTTPASCRDISAGFARWQARRVDAYINANLASCIGIRELAALTKLSCSHFSRAFKRTFGVPAHSYITRRRIEVAQTLMLTTAHSLSDIALCCGLSDQSHLTRWFRRIAGETPSAWRRNRLGAFEPGEPAFRAHSS